MEIITKESLTQLKEAINEIAEELDLLTLKSRLGELQTKTLNEGFWNDTNQAKTILSEMDEIKESITYAEELQTTIIALEDLFNTTPENERESLQIEFDSLNEKFKKFQTLRYLSGKYDKNSAIMSIHAGQGGTEADDWTSMLLRMYSMYCEKKGWKCTIEHLVPGTETGFSTVTMIIEGRYAFGLLKNEKGTHRLVRLSPFNSQNLRQTTFAGVEVMPLIDDTDQEIVIPESDIEFKAVRAGGPGGQHVNKTSSAVQIRHIPTGISVGSSEQRSQSQNRETAMRILKAKLWEIEEDKRLAELKNIKGEHKIAGWGNQIRNYVLHPYKLVKDLRTGVECTNPEAVLDGDLDQFIDAGLLL